MYNLSKMGKKKPENFTIGGILPLTQALNSHVSFRNHRKVRKSFLVQFLSKSTLDPSHANLHDPRGVTRQSRTAPTIIS